MNDTRDDIAEKYRSMFMKLDPVQRLKIGCRMFNTSRELIDLGIRLETGDTIGEKERQHRLFIRLYGQDLSREQIEAFIRKKAWLKI
ncbi:MAG: hypothetical protein JXA30_02480 [Deltaproteobacteria bacterium]|nr:hypothetical protein [Deltaproteobacteria bacterium]